MSTLTKLREADFSATEKRIAEYIIKHASRVPEITISEVAQACMTSKSMVVQFCKTAGFKGYKDLCGQIRVEQAISGRQEERDTIDGIHPGCSAAQIARLTFREEIRSLQDTEELLDTATIEQAVALLAKADKIMLFGVGGSAIAALDMYNKLSRIGLNARFSLDVHCQLLETSALTRKSVSLVFSFNGRTKDMLEACELSREAGAKVITVTRYGKNPVSDLGDICLRVASNESLRRVTAMSSRLSTMSMVDVLFACLASSMSDRIDGLVQRNAAIAERRIRK